MLLNELLQFLMKFLYVIRDFAFAGHNKIHTLCLWIPVSHLTKNVVGIANKTLVIGLVDTYLAFYSARLESVREVPAAYFGVNSRHTTSGRNNTYRSAYFLLGL